MFGYQFFAYIIIACAKGRAWQDALHLLHDMKETNVLPNEYTYSSAMTACGNCGQWKRALGLMDEVRSVRSKLFLYRRL